MRNILSPRSRSVLNNLASSNVLVAFDFDGTLAPIVSKPGKAAMRPQTRNLLRKLTAVYPCIVVSGRERADVMQKLLSIEFREFIGNHGIEPWNASDIVERTVLGWIAPLKAQLKHLQGAVLENKRFSLSVHYRLAPNKRVIRRRVIELAGKLPHAKLVGGKQLINIVHRDAPDKAVAVQRARQELDCDTVIYVGDDKTDDAVFALSGDRRFLTIRVGASSSSLAPFYIRNQLEIDRLLQILIELRANSPRAANGKA